MAKRMATSNAQLKRIQQLQSAAAAVAAFVLIVGVYVLVEWIGSGNV